MKFGPNYANQRFCQLEQRPSCRSSTVRDAKMFQDLAPRADEWPVNSPILNRLA